ncbi:hypothetical protein UlMin_041575 [Ulmus minor]
MDCFVFALIFVEHNFYFHYLTSLLFFVLPSYCSNLVVLATWVLAIWVLAIWDFADGLICFHHPNWKRSGSSSKLSFGVARTSNKTVRAPKNFTLKAPGPGYTSGPARVVRPSKFITADKRRVTQALMTWNVTCTYSQFLAHKTPTSFFSLSSFYNDTIVSCPTCSCGCRSNLTQPGSCVKENSPHLASVVSSSTKNNNAITPLVQCTSHMCPIREYWRVKVTLTNFNYAMNYTKWNMVVQHPNFDNLTQIFSFNFNPLTPYGEINDTVMLWGIKFYNDLLMEAGPQGNVQSKLSVRKDQNTFSFEKGWAFPQ